MGRNVAVIGLISDTHGLLRPEALRALDGAGLIIHAGDVGKPEILDALRLLAPVVAVRGNIDKGGWAAALPLTATAAAGPAAVHVLHDLQQLDLDPAAAGFQVVVSGHSLPHGTRRRPVPQSGQCRTSPLPFAGDRGAPGFAPVALESGVRRSVPGPRVAPVPFPLQIDLSRSAHLTEPYRLACRGSQALPLDARHSHGALTPVGTRSARRRRIPYRLG